MQQNLELLKQLKKELHESAPKIEGSIKATEKSFGFLETDKGKSHFVPPPQMKKVLHGDRVVATLKKDGDKEFVELDSLVETNLDRFIARVTFFKDKLQVQPDLPQIKRSLPAATAADVSKADLKEGDWVVAELKQHGLKDGRFKTEVIRKICTADSPDQSWLVSLARHNLPESAPIIEQESFEQLPDSQPRQDLTDLPLFTIDSATTKDMDDALYAEKHKDGGWMLTVAIADPTAYIAEDSEVDNIAKSRGYTTYLPGRNIPMLPRVLSDELCSLQSGVKRAALCCKVHIGSDGHLAGEPVFFTAWIESKAKLTYEEISNWFEQEEEIGHDQQLLAPLQALKELAEASMNWRRNNAVIFPDRPDYRFKLDETGKVVAIFADQRRIAHKMVEEAMVLANICAARFLAPFGVGLYNTHIGYEVEKREEAAQVATDQGYEVTAEQLGELSGFSAFRRQLIAEENTWLDSRLRRYQAYVETSTKPAPHYGMGLEGYATWTSPIRKYSDMVNHRLIKQALTDASALNTESLSDALLEQMDQQRMFSRLAERDTNNWLYCQFLKPAVEEETLFEAEIFDISRGGMRVRLLENGASPFIPGSMIHKERKEMTLDNNSGQVFVQGEVRYRLGDKIQVQLIKVDEERRSLLAKPAQPLNSEAANAEAEKAPAAE